MFFILWLYKVEMATIGKAPFGGFLPFSNWPI